MKEINIARVLARKRKEKGITQDELANYVGVSKASVSKWETEQSYPDITFLPQLAAYFNISVDELIDYQPQMTREDIHKLYRRLSVDFTAKPFETVLTECREIIKKYYACFPLLLQMGLLMVNHVELVKGTPQAAALLEEARALFVRVKEESDDVALTKKALYMEAYCSLVTGDAKGALVLLEDSIEPAMPPEILMASAYQMTGRPQDAQEVLQVGIYQNIVVLFNFFPAYLNLCVGDVAKFDEILRRALAISDQFKYLVRHSKVGIYSIGFTANFSRYHVIRFYHTIFRKYQIHIRNQRCHHIPNITEFVLDHSFFWSIHHHITKTHIQHGKKTDEQH